MHYYPHHIGDFMADAGSLPNESLGAYMRMLWRYYADETPLSGEVEDIAFDAGTTPEIARQILRRFFVPDGSVWRNSRCDKVIAEYHGKAEKAKKSANARWNDANAMRTQCERIANASDSDANQEPITKKKKDQKTLRPSLREDADTELAELLVDIPADLLRDYKKVRKAKKAALTARAIRGLIEAGRKGGKTLAEVLEICCAESWVGYNHTWQRANARDLGPAGNGMVRAGPESHANGKTVSAIIALEGLKNG